MECLAYSAIRNRILPELEALCRKTDSNPDIHDIFSDKNKLSQFILDPTSLNLHSRINASDPQVGQIFQLCRDYCFSIHKCRMKILNQEK